MKLSRWRPENTEGKGSLKISGNWRRTFAFKQKFAIIYFMEKEKLILIDGNALLYRSFYALPPLTNSQGIPTGGVYGFTRILLKLLREENPTYLACAFDKGKKTFRHKKYKEYKATRPKTPQELITQISLIKEVLEGFDIPIFEEEEYEADDILVTLAKEAEQMGLQVKIFTGDKDILQGVSSSICIVRFKKGISQTQLFDEEQVKKEYGVSPSQIADYLSLTGDVSDNIPGVPGIGPVTARNLIQRFGNLENLLANLEQISAKVSEILKKYSEQARLSKKLATVLAHIPVKVDLNKFKVSSPQKDLLFPLFKKLEFKELIKQLGGPTPSSSPLSFKDISSQEQLENLIHKLSQETFVIEVGEKELVFSPLQKEEVFQIALNQKNLSKDFILNKLCPVLENPGIKKIGHNLKCSILKLRKMGLSLKGLDFDTQIASYLLNPLSTNYSLKDLSFQYAGEYIEDSSSMQRVKIIKKLYFPLKDNLKKLGMWDLFSQIEMPLIEVLEAMQEKGIKVDKNILNDFLCEIREKREEIEEEIYREVGEEFNINSSQQLGKILFEKLHLPVVKKTKTGYSTDEEVLQVLSRIHPSLKKIMEYRHLFKLESTYIQPFPNLINPTTGRIHASFNQTVTATGRLSSSQPNLQNIPIKEKLGERIRKAFVAEKNHLFLSADYSQIELRILAHLSKDPNLKSTFTRGEDIHQQTAAEIFSILPLQVTSQMRRQAKVVNFGIVYGISSYGLSRDLGISEKEASEYITKYFNRYPKVRKYIEKTLEKARKNHYVTTLTGRRRYLPEINSPNRRRREFAERTAINSPIQGGAADLIKIAMINLYQRFKQEKTGAWILLQIHDELLFEVPCRKIEEIKRIVKKEMEGAMKLSVSLLVKIKVGKNWAEMR